MSASKYASLGKRKAIALVSGDPAHLEKLEVLLARANLRNSVPRPYFSEELSEIAWQLSHYPYVNRRRTIRHHTLSRSSRVLDLAAWLRERRAQRVLLIRAFLQTVGRIPPRNVLEACCCLPSRPPQP